VIVVDLTVPLTEPLSVATTAPGLDSWSSLAYATDPIDRHNANTTAATIGEYRVNITLSS
jgi:hypothetical protein